MYGEVKIWMEQLPAWQRTVHRILSAIGQDEIGYNWFGYYAWSKRRNK